MEINKSNNLAVCIICGVLTAFGFVASIVSLANGSKGLFNIFVVNDLIYFLISVFIGYYAIQGYKKPHGNLLKLIILAYAASFLILIFQCANNGFAWGSVTYTITIGILCYAAGRLHRAKQNLIFMSILTVLILIINIAPLVVGGKPTIGVFTQVIIWIDICVAYFLRYKEHKEAGLMDKAEN